MMSQIIISVTAGLIIAAVSGMAGVLRERLKQATRTAVEHETQDRRRSELTNEGVRELLLCKLESLRHTMVLNGGIADDDLKARAQRLYDIYHQMGGNGHGTELNRDIQRAPIAPRPVSHNE
ncbi:hypothetical protein JS536_08980 [Bifidobacterium sp. SO4]|nr:hypothetical protein [Bifidobacterium sp. SO4]